MSKTANKVLKNTFILYGKMLLTVALSLYTTRLVVNSLGHIDFGIFTLIAGVILMLSFLNAAMTTSTQRFLSYYQGVNDSNSQKLYFSNSLILHIFLAILLFIILLAAMPFLFNGFLNIPSNRIEAAKLVYICMGLSIVLTVFSVPFVASINANENMYWIALVNIIEVMLKLIVAIMLTKGIVFEMDTLIFYGFSSVIVSLISLLMYAFFSLKKYDECTITLSKKIKLPIIKEMTSFAGWNLFGALCGLGRTQGLAIILNIFNGTLVNTAYGIANQVSNQMCFFSATMLRALNPQIMKSEGSRNRRRTLDLSMSASKFGFFLLAIIAIPAIFEMDVILNFWLKDAPLYSTLFTQLILIGFLFSQTTIGIQSAVQAIGRIKSYQAIVGSFLLLNIPIAYILLKLNFNIYSVLYSYVIIEFFSCVFRILFLRKIAGLRIKDYIKRVYARIFFPVLVSVGTCLFITQYSDIEYRILITIVTSVLVFSLSVYFIGLEPEERQYLRNIIKYFKKKYV